MNTTSNRITTTGTRTPRVAARMKLGESSCLGGAKVSRVSQASVTLHASEMRGRVSSITRRPVVVATSPPEVGKT